MVSATFLLVILVLFSGVLSQDFSQLLEVRFLKQSFYQIEQQNFGKSLLDTIELEIQSNQGVGDLLKVLDQMRDTMNEEKESSELDHQQFQQVCAKDIFFYINEVNESTVIVVDTDWKIDHANEEIKNLEALLEEAYAQLNIYTDYLQKLKAGRQEEALAFRDSMNEYDITTAAIEEAKRYFVQIRGEVSFIQTKKQILVQVAAHFNQAKQLIKSKSYQSLFNVLAQMSQNADFNNAEIVTKILELCNRVLENVDESRNAEQTAQQKKIDIFMQKKQIIEASIADKQKQIDPLEIQKAAITEQLTLQKSIKEDQEGRQQQNEKLLEARQNECQNEIDEYSQLRQKEQFQFLDQINICEQVITLVNTNFVNVNQYLKERKSK